MRDQALTTVLTTTPPDELPPRATLQVALRQVSHTIREPARYGMQVIKHPTRLWQAVLVNQALAVSFDVIVHAQAYQEIREDGHPVVILAGRDLVEILKKSGHDTAAAIRRFLSESYPLPPEADHQR